MNFLLDTNAVSEPNRHRPDLGFIEWVRSRSAWELNTSVLVVGELHRGVMRLPDTDRRRAIEDWVAQVVVDFEDRVLPIDLDVAAIWADIAHDLKRAGKVIGAIDELIAATALAHDLTLVTRNLRHFEPTGCKLLSPWSA